jgi:2-keto-4-pentenoate hydratase/2-oxohepta-3-ene-1,7-dioic acid hydratase in catechol pathway
MKIGRALVNGLETLIVIDSTRKVAWRAEECFDNLQGHADGDMRSLIEAFPLLKAKIATTLGMPMSEIRLLTPLPNPRHNVMCVGKNYLTHALEFSKSGFDGSDPSNAAAPEHPIIFTKPSSSISGPESDIPMWPGLDEAMDYEAELGVIISKEGRNISRQDASAYIFGYVVINDVTARDLQKQHRQWFLGKGIDGFCPIGPWISTASEVNLNEAFLQCKVNGETRQRASFQDLIFDIPCIIETISRCMTLSPGDIIATGTPEGVGIGVVPPRFLKDGDVVECQIDGIGSIKNTVRRQVLDSEDNLFLVEDFTRKAGGSR